MAKSVFIAGIISLIVCSCASTAGLTPEEKAKKEEDKRIEAYQDSMKHVIAVESLKNLNFALEADKVILKRGRSFFVTPTTNFISAADGKATVQVASMRAGAGLNGIGGITVEGNTSKVVTKTDKKGNFSLSMYVNGVGISASVFISLPAKSSTASANVVSNFHSYNITLQGNVVPFNDSNIYKGRSL